MTHALAFALGIAAGWYARRLYLTHRANRVMRRVLQEYAAAAGATMAPQHVDVVTNRDGVVRVERASVVWDKGETWEPFRWVPGGKS